MNLLIKLINRLFRFKVVPPAPITREQKIKRVRELLSLENEKGKRKETGERINWYTGSCGSFRLIYGVWVDSRLEYEAMEIPMGIAPPNRPDVFDNSPGIPESVLGSCGCCKISWKWLKGHSTQYTKSSGCFPLCEKCWSDLTPETRLPYYRELFNKWQSNAYRYGYTATKDEVWFQIREAVLSGK